MQPFTLFIASRTEEENQLIKRKLAILTNEFPQLRFVGLHPQGLASSASERIASVIINVADWGRNEAINLNALRAAGYRGPVLVMAKPTNTQALKTLRAMDHVVFLEKPFEEKDLLGIASKMLTERVVAQRVHRRFNTSETAHVECFGRNDVYLSRVCNLSKGGACLELPQAAPAMRVGDMLRLKVELNDVRRIYTVSGRVVWTNRPGPRPESLGGANLGVEFVGVPDVKKTALAGF